MRAPTAMIKEGTARPMTSVKGAGFSSVGTQRQLFDPLKQSSM